jgi:hypothetical protein
MEKIHKPDNGIPSGGIGILVTGNDCSHRLAGERRPHIACEFAGEDANGDTRQGGRQGEHVFDFGSHSAGNISSVRRPEAWG